MSEAGGRALSAVSWNVHGCVGRDGRKDVRRCVAVLESLAPAVVALQEVDSRDGEDAWETFAGALGLHAVPGPTLAGGRGRYGNLLLSTLPVREVRFHDLSFGGREPRRAIDADLDAPWGGRLRVVATHLGLRRRERVAQRHRLAEAIRRRWDGGAFLLLGDLNEWWRPASTGAKLHAGLASPGLPRTFPSRRPVLALDQAWVFPGELGREAVAVRTAQARLASDHLPLRVTLSAGAG